MWKIQIHPLVLEKDFSKIDSTVQRKILKAIHKKLSSSPEQYGKPLGGPFKNYWRLRVEDYRVIYRIEKDCVEVFVVKVGIRRDDEVYRQFALRLTKLAR